MRQPEAEAQFKDELQRCASMSFDELNTRITAHQASINELRIRTQALIQLIRAPKS